MKNEISRSGYTQIESFIPFLYGIKKPDFQGQPEKTPPIQIPSPSRSNILGGVCIHKSFRHRFPIRKDSVCVCFSKRAAFTLIELLVVIAIIAILLGIMVPSLKKAKEQLRIVLCKNNLKNYGMVASMYISDNKDTLPNAWTSFYNRHEEYPPDENYPQAEPHRYCRWHNPRFDLTRNPQYAGPLWPYLEMKQVQICPKFLEIARRFGNRHPQHVETVPIVPNYNYAMNQHLGERKISEIRNPSQIFFFSEENLWLTEGWCTYVFNDTALCVIQDAHNSQWDDIQPWDCFGTFHNAKDAEMETGFVNAVFVDGDVQTVHRDESQRYSIIKK